jgi:AcrR family transcriptional regulator
MERVAARCEVNKALPYRYFANSDDLILALFQRETTRFDARIVAVFAECDSIDDRLRAIVDALLDSVEESSMLVTQFEQSRPPDDPFEEARRRREETALGFLAGMIGEAFPLPPKQALAAAAILATSSQGLIGLVQYTELPREWLVDRFLVMCRGALQALVDDPT